MFLVPLLNNYCIKQINNNNICLDPLIDSDYCIIHLKGKLIICSYFQSIDAKQTFCQINFYNVSSNLLLDIIAQHQFLLQSISLSHALYLGKEIYKAELSKILSQLYIQL